MYIQLLKDFVDRHISSSEFESKFLELFKKEVSFNSEEEFKILDKLFGDVDSYCSDMSLFDPEFDIDETNLRLSAQETLTALERKIKEL
ncbi:colicin immunity domain-containing protein [Geitlerinema calcuttense]|uniref:Colicin immunity domain-containing protein n=1 Tax=Geitlerinema calcuttense NRMC-F 0142 TaxID=2922238 RepID=A0ABT7LYC4_9CYAN|nr:colicin immunity domain-containing protein [Geitlerinema calcuttense]MDL5057010.1 colicin immunity domain-containing protein [Geitlerinema calcuttense NRMC-F 0142]